MRPSCCATKIRPSAANCTLVGLVSPLITTLSEKPPGSAACAALVVTTVNDAATIVTTHVAQNARETRSRISDSPYRFSTTRAPHRARPEVEAIASWRRLTGQPYEHVMPCLVTGSREPPTRRRAIHGPETLVILRSSFEPMRRLKMWRLKRPRSTLSQRHGFRRTDPYYHRRHAPPLREQGAASAQGSLSSALFSSFLGDSSDLRVVDA